MQGPSNDSTNLKKINGTTVDTGSGASSAGTQRVILATDQPTHPVTVASLPLPSGAATEATVASRLSESDFDTKVGSLTEAAPASDTASSGLNGRLQRIAQRITSLIALIPTALGQSTMANSFRVVLASDQSAIPVTNTVLSVVGTGTEATAQRVTIATDSTGVLSVDDNGASITVDAPVGTPVFTRLSDGSAALGSGSGTAAAALRVELPTNGTGVIATVGAVTAITNALPAGTNAIGKLAANSGVDIGDVDVLSIIPGVAATNLGKAEDAGHNSGDVGVMALGVRKATATDLSAGPTDGDYEPFQVSTEGALWSTLTPTTTSGLSISRDIDLDNGTLTVVKASAGNLYGYYIFNAHSATVYVKFYNVTSGTLGTGTPVLTFPVPAGGGANVSFAYPISFATGICVGAGTGVADADNTDPGANLVIANIFYK